MSTSTQLRAGEGAGLDPFGTPHDGAGLDPHGGG